MILENQQKMKFCNLILLLFTQSYDYLSLKNNFEKLVDISKDVTDICMYMYIHTHTHVSMYTVL
jgi:hypothetical protein